MRQAGHRVLVVEDEPDAREILCEILRSRGDSPRGVATVEEALAAIEEEEFCYFVLDQQLPVDGSALKAFIAGGERVIAAARKTDRRRTPADDHVTPIVALTGYPGGPQWVAGLFERGITAYVEKPVHAHMELFLDKLRGALERAGRAEHGQCAALAQRTVASDARTAEPAGPVTVAIDGKVSTNRRTFVEINGSQRDMQDGKFAVLVRCIVARDRSLDAWSSRDALGIGTSQNATTYIRDTFKGLVPEGFEVLEGDGRGNCRLNPAIVVARVAWDALTEHPDPAVARIAQERRKRRGVD